MPSEGQCRTEVLEADARGVAFAARRLLDGELVAFPTETVYGLGADATAQSAVAAVFEAKGRPRTDPLILHVDGLDMAGSIGDLDSGSGVARRLAEAFWPGPLTVVVPRWPSGNTYGSRSTSGPGSAQGGGGSAGGAARMALAPEVSMGPTVGIRCPAHAVALELIEACGVPLAAPSANRFGRVSPTSADHVLAELDGRIPWVLDGGPTPLGVESTVVAVEPGSTGDTAAVRVLRPGGVPTEEIEALLPPGALVDATTATVVSAGEVAESPGTSVSHYAPGVPVVFTSDGPGLRGAVASALADRGLVVREIELPAPVEAAKRLYSVLRGLDDPQPGGRTPDVAVVAAVDPGGLGRAVNDRLLRAAHGHVRSDADPATIDAIVAGLERFSS